MNSEKIIKDWENYIEKNLIPLVGSHPEGNIYSKHLSTAKLDLMKPKQYNIVNLIHEYQPQNVLEIGFNAGFSALLMKMTKPNINLMCVDINEHNYVAPCYNKIKTDFYHFELIMESSLIALPKLIEQGFKYDIIHIDGDHRIEGAKKDFELCLKLSKKGTVIIFDDTDMEHLNDLCEDYVNKKIVRDYNFNNKVGCSNLFQHRFLEV